MTDKLGRVNDKRQAAVLLFCGKSRMSRKLIAAPSVFICDECVESV